LSTVHEYAFIHMCELIPGNTDGLDRAHQGPGEVLYCVRRVLDLMSSCTGELPSGVCPQAVLWRGKRKSMRNGKVMTVFVQTACPRQHNLGASSHISISPTSYMPLCTISTSTLLQHPLGKGRYRIDTLPSPSWT
jgi:hypothetical protein